MDEPTKVPVTGADPATPLPTANNFMDIQAPKPVTVTDGSEDASPPTSTAPVVESSAVNVPVTSDTESVSSVTNSWESEIPPSNPSAETASVVSGADSPAGIISEPTPPAPTEPEPTPPAPFNAEAASQDEQPQPAPATQAPHPHKSGAPVGTIIIAIVIALVLAGLAVFAYNRSKNQPAASKTPASQPAASKTPATASDVDATNQQIDASLATVDDNKDFAATELSDATLGL